MMIAALAYWGVLLGGPVVGAAVFVAGRRVMPLWLARILGVVLVFGGLIGGCAIQDHPEAYVFSGAGDDISMKKYFLIGRGATYTLANGTSIELDVVKSDSSGYGMYAYGAFYVNDTDRDLKVIEVSYGASFGDDDDRIIARGQSWLTHGGPDNVGPDDHPPSKIRSPVSFGGRTWVTWQRDAR